MTQKRCKKLLMGMGVNRNGVSEIIKMVRAGDITATDGYSCYEEIILEAIAVNFGREYIQFLFPTVNDRSKRKIGKAIRMLREMIEIRRKLF